MNKKWVTIGIIGVLVIGGGYWSYKKFTSKPAQAKMGNVSKVMNANLDIIVAEVNNVLTVPSEAIKTRGTKKGVLVPSNTPKGSADNSDSATQQTKDSKSTTGAGSGQIGTNQEFIPVECGLDDGSNVEIISGLKEGQEVITGVSASATAKAATGGFSLGGGNRAVNGGPPRN